MRLEVTYRGLEELHEVLRNFSPGTGARFVGPALNAAARVVARTIAADARAGRYFTRRFGRGSRDVRDRASLGDYGRNRGIFNQRIFGDFGGQKFRGAAARVIARFPHAHLVELGQPGSPKARPYRGGPQRAGPRPFIKGAQDRTTGAQEQAFSDSLEKRFPALARRLAQRGPGRAVNISRRVRQLSLKGRRRR